MNTTIRTTTMPDHAHLREQPETQTAPVTIADVEQRPHTDGCDLQLAALQVALGGPPAPPPGRVAGAPVSRLFAAFVDQRADPGRAREKLLACIVERFGQLAFATDSTSLFGVTDVRRILAAPPGTFDAQVVDVARQVEAHPDILSLADWTHPSSGQHAHDRTSTHEEYARALALVQHRAALTPALAHVLAGFDRIAGLTGHRGGAIERADLVAEIARLAGGCASDQALAATLSMVLDARTGGAGSPPPCDLVSVLANASGNTHADVDAQLVTRDGLARLEALVNGADLSVRQREAQCGDRRALVADVIAHFDALRGADVYLQPRHLDAVLADPSAFAPDVVRTAAALRDNLDLMTLADAIDSARHRGQGTLDRQTAMEQYQAICTLMQHPGCTAALDHLIDRYADLQRLSETGKTTLTPGVLQGEIERLRSGGASEQAIAATLSLPLGVHDVDVAQLLANFSGNNVPDDAAAISFESLHALRRTLTRGAS